RATPTCSRRCAGPCARAARSARSASRSATSGAPTTPNEPSWVDWARRLQAIAQNGLEFATDDYDRLRYEQVRTIAAEMAAAGSAQPLDHVLDLFGRDDGYATPKLDVRGAVFRDGR